MHGWQFRQCQSGSRLLKSPLHHILYFFLSVFYALLYFHIFIDIPPHLQMSFYSLTAEKFYQLRKKKKTFANLTSCLKSAAILLTGHSESEYVSELFLL